MSMPRSGSNIGLDTIARMLRQLPRHAFARSNTAALVIMPRHRPSPQPARTRYRNASLWFILRLHRGVRACAELRVRDARFRSPPVLDLLLRGCGCRSAPRNEADSQGGVRTEVGRVGLGFAEIVQSIAARSLSVKALLGLTSHRSWKIIRLRRVVRCSWSRRLGRPPRGSRLRP